MHKIRPADKVCSSLRLPHIVKDNEAFDHNKNAHHALKHRHRLRLPHLCHHGDCCCCTEDLKCTWALQSEPVLKVEKSEMCFDLRIEVVNSIATNMKP